MSESTAYALHYIVESTVEKLFTFTVSGAVLEELGRLAFFYRNKIMDHDFKSLEILETLT